MRHGTLPAVLLVVALAASPAAAPAADLFASPAGAGTACTMADPCALQVAIDAAAPWDIVWLARGTFTGGGGAVATITKSLTLRGGWNGRTGVPPKAGLLSETTLDGERARRGIEITGPGITVVLENVAVSRGRHALKGGGISAVGADLTLRWCSIVESAASSGTANVTSGGALNMAGGRLVVEYGLFLGNFADCAGCGGTYGGAIAVFGGSAVISASDLWANDALEGGAIFFDGAPGGALTIAESSFDQNGAGLSGSSVAGRGGGAIHAVQATLAVDSSGFAWNAATGEGGAVLFSGAEARVERSRFIGNIAEGSASVKVASSSGARVVNCYFRDNAPAGDPAVASTGIEIAAGPAEVLHATVLGTGGGGAGAGIRAGAGAGTVTVRNTILGGLDPGIRAAPGAGAVSADGVLWGAEALANTFDVIDEAGGAVTLGPACLTGDPMVLVDEPGGTPWLAAGSPARDAGVATGIGGDIQGAPRDALPDIGASEYQAKVVLANPLPHEVVRLDRLLYLLQFTGPARAVVFNISYSLDGGGTWRSRRIDRGLSRLWPVWILPAARGNRRSCYIRVTGFDKAGRVVGRDRSGPFEIRLLQVDAPAAGETLQGGTTQVISWSTFPGWLRVAAVRLYLSTDGGSRWNRIRPAVPRWNPGRYEWVVPSFSSLEEDCRLKVVLLNAAGRSLAAAGTGRFTITPP